ncbi:hypothetical protein ACNQPY_26360 [Mycobacteroides abscessus]|uniref:hypothetical protein n=1 Tax=Mycobacteroides abscessus TaxID=36809 RepID=UPI003AB0C094
MASMDQLTEYAKNGELVLHLDDEAFDQLIRACDVFIDDLHDLHRKATDLSYHPIGCEHLDSGAQLAKVFQNKAGGDFNSAASTFTSHIERVEEMKTLFIAIRAAHRQTEEANAAKFKGNGYS